MNINIEYNDQKLKPISEELYNLFQKNNYNVYLNNQNAPANSLIINNILGNNDLEIIYPLEANDELANILYNNLQKIINVAKYYQLRLPGNTSQNYYAILNNPKAIVLKYGTNILNTPNLAKIIYQSIISYLEEENIYIVKAGDSLYALAKRFNTTVDAIKSLNNLSNNNLSINQRLIIPSSNNTPTNDNIYVIKAGDTLYALAKRFNTTVNDIKRINNLTSNNLSINQKLIIPTLSNTNTYYVQAGDTLYALAKKYNTTVDAIKKLNNLTNNNLSINQKIILP